MRFLKRFSLIVATTAVLLATYFWLLSPVNTNPTKIEFQITKGQSVGEISSNLQKLGLVRSALLLKTYLYVTGLHKQIQAGYFYLSPSENLTQISQDLTHAVTKDVRVTIPEGLRHEEIANLILDTLVTTKLPNRFDADLFIRKTATLEGQLYPDTYSLSPGITTDQVINLLTSQFVKVISSLAIPPANQKQVVVLASILERETATDAERPEVAGILLNRINGNWPLQVDATVQYALSSSRCRNRLCIWWPRPLTKTYLQINSPLNTYLYTGLPISPISNPGQKSLAAAARPNKTTNWFYLHDASGQIHYAATVEQHNQNICLYLKKDC